MGRNIKLNDNFLNATKDVLNNDVTPLLLDGELLLLVNEKLEPKDRICEKTFINYQKLTDSKSETIKTFLQLLKKARTINKQNLIIELRKAGSYWQRFAWLLERKYSTEYNLKQELHHTTEPITININLDNKLPTHKILQIDKERKLTTVN